MFNYEDAEISVNRWEYSEKQHIMEVQLDIKNNSLANNSIFTYDAVERSKGILTVEAVVDEQDFIVLRIKDIPDKWREISLRLQKNKSSDPLKLYTNKNSIDYVDSLKNLSELEYRILNIESIISGYQEDIVGLNKKIKKLQDNIDTIQNNISDLEKEKEYQTKQEQTNTDTLISAAESDISNYETEIQECKNTISEYTERIENAEQKKSDLQHSH